MSFIFKAMPLPMPMDARPSLFKKLPQSHHPTNHSQLIKQHTTIPTSALGILKFYEDKVKELAEENQPPETSQQVIISNDIFLSPTGVMKLARDKLLEMNSIKDADVFSIIATCFCDIPSDDFEDLEIAVILQAAAEKVAHKKFRCANKLLSLCNHSAFKTGTIVQRTVFYFAKALKERINRELGTCLGLEVISQKFKKPIDVRQTQISLHPATIAHEQNFSVVAINQFTGIQVILDYVSSAKKIHLIDFRIRNGWQWAILMQALAGRHGCPVELVRITAIGTCKEMLEKTGRWLSSFAESMKLPFSFDHVVSELNEVREDMFKIKANETVAIYSSVCLFSLVAFPSRLESLIRVIKKLKPCVMVVNEVHQTKDSPNFIERFTNTLFFVSALFDCVSVCGGRNNSYRILAEEVHLWDLIQNTVVAEGTDRIFRHEEVSFWRAVFAKFGMVEIGISSAALCQAKLMVECSPGRSFYNLGMDGKCMVLGWKGTTIEFLSAWKFNHGYK